MVGGLGTALSQAGFSSRVFFFTPGLLSQRRSQCYEVFTSSAKSRS